MAPTTGLIQWRRQLDLLRDVALFEHLDDSALSDLARRSSVRRWHASAIICGKNEPPRALYIVAEGHARAVLFGENGREITLNTLKVADFFGETSLMDGKPCATNLVAHTDCLILVLDRASFIAHLSEYPQTALSLLTEMAERTRQATRLIGDLALRDVAERLTRTLIALGEEQGHPHADGVMIPYRPTQQDLANRVGTCRETVSRALSSMAKRGLVVSRGRSLLLREPLVQRVQAAA